ncbi:MAG: AAA family ATPase [Pseudomonadota bacterium]
MLDLVKVEVHHWGGLHAHCVDDGQPPGPLTLEMDSALTMVRGRNGAGKTSLANAIRWALTGQVAGSQGPPRPEPGTTAPRFADEVSGEASFALPSIVPMPAAADLDALRRAPLVATRVVLTFRQPDGADIVVERRVIPEGRTRFSTITIPAEGPERALGVSGRAIEVSALIFSLLPHLDLGKRNPLGEAVAVLTGLQPLEELGRRSVATVRYLRNQATELFRKEQSTASVQFREEKARLLQLIGDHPELGLPGDLGEPRDIETAGACREELSMVRTALETAQGAHGLSLAELAGLDANGLNGARVDEIRAQVVKARVALAHLDKLDQLMLMRQISSITDGEADEAVALCDEIVRTAQAFVVRETSQEAAARRRLYAAVMHWHRGENPGAGCPAACPVCATPLDAVGQDPALGIPVEEALREAISAGVETRMPVASWAREAELQFLTTLPATIRTLVERRLPPSPHESYRAALCDDLLADPAFASMLRPLASRARAKWAELQAQLPPFEAVKLPQPPAHLAGFTASLFAKVGQVLHLLALRVWRTTHAGEARAAVAAMVKEGTSEEAVGRSIPEELRIMEEGILALKPVADGLEIVGRAERALENWCTVEHRILAAERCAEAVSGFSGISALVQEQVGDLMEALNDRTLHWLGLAYRHPTDNRPKLCRFEREEGATLRAVASYQGVSGPAEGITNSSAQRAYLWAFSVALWERLRDQGSALSLLVLDDPQTLFDEGNTQLLGAAIAKLTTAGAQPLVVTSNECLCEQIRAGARAEGVPACSLELIPRSHGQAIADLRISESGLGDRRKHWKTAKDHDDRIKAFVGAAREHLEARFCELLDHPAARLPKSRTLQPLMDEVRRLNRLRVAPFGESVFAQLVGCPPLQPGSPFREAINEAHHGAGRPLVTADAVEVDDKLDGVLKVMQNCQDMRWAP